MDPYCVLLCNDQRVKTKVCKKGGKNPKWSETFILNASTEHVITIRIRDKEAFAKDELIAEGQLPVLKIAQLGKIGEWVPVFYKGKPAGNVLIEATFVAQ
mmetsp:Transcript_22784/g.19803  ORF Transcript_22784/g.19803 Transcript_22784/m.19803 type:complete len:100 (-) Transcript_22784:104-403(-)